MTFYDAFPLLMEFEGYGYTDHPSDTGGKTKWGITEKVARENGFDGDMKNLSMGMAMTIAKAAYWDAILADELPEPIRYPMFDAAYNSGVSQAIKWLQRACLVRDDGVIGPQTLAAVQKHDPAKIKAKICGKRLEFLANLKNFNVFGKGWTRRVAAILEM